MHGHILSQLPQIATSKSQSPDEWYLRSHAALDTATKMILDIVEAHENPDPHLFACVAPSYSYIVGAALKHIHAKNQWREDTWLRVAEERLRTSLDEFSRS